MFKQPVLIYNNSPIRDFCTGKAIALYSNLFQASPLAASHYTNCWKSNIRTWEWSWLCYV